MGYLTLFTELAGSLRLILSLIDRSQANKYIDELQKLEDERNEELQKPEYEGDSGEIPKNARAEYMDHATLDELDRRLCQLSNKIGAEVRGKNPLLK